MVHTVLTLILNQKMGFTASQVSFFMVALGIANMLFCMIGGKLSDRYNKKHCIICCDCVSVLLYFVCSAIPLSMFSLVLLAIAGVAQFMERPMYNALIADITTPENRQKAYALQYLGINMGLLFAPTLAGILFKNHLPLLFFLCAVAIGSSTILIAFLVRNIEPEKITNVREERRDGVGILKILWDNKILTAYILLMAMYSAVYSQYTYLMPLDMGRMYGEDGALLFGTINSTNCFIVVLFSPILLRVLRSIKPQWKMHFAQIMVALGIATYITYMTEIPAYYISMILFTFGEILAMLGGQPFFAAYTPASHRGRVSGLRDVLGQASDSIFMIISGYLYDTRGYMYAWQVVLGVICAVILLMMLLNTRIRNDGKV